MTTLQREVATTSDWRAPKVDPEEGEMSLDKLEPSDEKEFEKDYDDDDDSSVDENAHLKQLQPGAQQHSIRRNDSFDSFITRSERALLLGKDLPPPPSEASRRRIKFSESLEDIKEIERVHPEVKEQYWMTNSDFDRIESEIRITQFRWENAQAGKIPFDEINNSIRGLESVIPDEKTNVDVTLFNHRRSVLQEIHRQKSLHGAVVDWDKVRQASQRYSKRSMQRATEVAAQDELAHKKAWDMVVIETIITPIKGGRVDRKKQTSKGNPFLFWRKN
jgi:hypothetical protein